MILAFLYLQATSLKNQLVERLRRLRQPKYLAGALAGAAYFYFFFFRHVTTTSRPHHERWPAPLGVTPEWVPLLITMLAFALLVVAALIWIIPNSRAALRFTEAEVAFLFPAPVARRQLIHFKLLRSQLGILVSAFFFTLIFRRASALGGNPWTHAAGWWLVLSTINLHLLGASFARDQLLARGVGRLRRGAFVLGGLALLAVGGWWWVSRHVAAPSTADLADLTALIRYLGAVLTQAPFSWLLAPFRWVLQPYFAPTTQEFFLALGPALLVLVAHYRWVIRADVAFEEASLNQARQLDEKIAAARAGDWRGAATPATQPRPEPFSLGAQGPAIVAFLWKNLLALGPLFRARSWLIAAALIVAFHIWAGQTRLGAQLQMFTFVVPLALGGWLLLVGPLLMRSDLRLLVSHFDLLKSYPLRGWQVVLGSLLPSLVILAAIEWLLLLLAAPSAGAAPGSRDLSLALLGTGALGIALVLPPLSGLMLSIPYAATLLFPAWAETRGARGGGIEAMGQRLIFFAGYLVVLVTALLPAVLCGGLTAFIAHWLGGWVPAIVSAALVSSLILGAEFAAAVWWLGERFERFDLSTDLPR